MANEQTSVGMAVGVKKVYDDYRNIAKASLILPGLMISKFVHDARIPQSQRGDMLCFDLVLLCMFEGRVCSQERLIHLYGGIPVHIGNNGLARTDNHIFEHEIWQLLLGGAAFQDVGQPLPAGHLVFFWREKTPGNNCPAHVGVTFNSHLVLHINSPNMSFPTMELNTVAEIRYKNSDLQTIKTAPPPFAN